MKHLDLFSGIGGFALAVDRVYPNAEHTFCDNDKFCQAVLKKHWPQSKIYEDIRTLTNASSEQSDKRESENHRPLKNEKTNRSTKEVEKRNGTFSNTDTKRKLQSEGSEQKERERFGDSIDLLTGGFPCQPFSQAGRRKGTDDDRYLWPEMLRVTREFRPTWVIAENVRGLATWNDGMVLEQVCTDMESQGYEVQPFIIPAVSVNAPHRRDRIWFIAHREGERNRGVAGEKCGIQKRKLEPSESQGCEIRGKGKRCLGEQDASDTDKGRVRRYERESVEERSASRSDWERNWVEVAFQLCRVDDGLSAELDGLKLTKPAHRREQLKAYGNAIVPQVAEMIMRAIKTSEK
ncbi:MAG: DNA (cytosine-5-)-methyltransferase [Patescibacteria group bacterium]|jgi:DNA (cytosine-5)-methyltransferase 1